MANLSNFGDLKTRLGQILGMDQPSQLTLLGEFINEAGQEVYHAHAWPRRKMYAVLKLEASVDVDAATGGLAGTLGSDVLTTIDGRDFTALAEWKIGRGGLPAAEWYWINADHGSSGAGAAKVNHAARETFSGEAYAIFKDEYALHADVHTVVANEVHLLGPDNTVLAQLSQADAAEFWPDPTGFGAPRRFVLASYDPATSAQDENANVGTSATIRIRVGPLAPDEPYSIRYGFLRRWKVLTGDSDVPLLDYALRPLIIEGALVLAYNYLDEFRDNSRLIERQEARFHRQMRRAVRNNRPLRPKVAFVRPFDKPSRHVGLRYTLPPED